MGRDGAPIMPILESVWFPYIAVAAVAAVLLILLLAFIRERSKTKRIIQRQKEVNTQFDRDIKKTNKQLLELRSVMVGLGQKLNDQQEIIQFLNERIVELENSDNDGRLYSRASKMVQLGADVDELIEECELPKAEAELMLSLQNKIRGKQLPDEPAKRAPVRPASPSAQPRARGRGRYEPPKYSSR